MNLYQMYSMKPPSKTAMADRLTGARSRTTGVAVPVAKSSATKRFFVRDNEVPTSLPNIRTPYPLGTQGGLAGLGMLGALSGPPLGAGGIEFTFDLDRADFFGRSYHQQGLKKLKLFWAPPDSGLVSEADKKLNLLRASGSRGSSIAAALIQEGQRRADRIHAVGEKVAFEAPLLGARGEVDVFGKVINDQPERQRIEAMEDLKQWLETVVATPVPEKVTSSPGSGSATSGSATSGSATSGGTTTGDPTMDALIAAQTRKDQEGNTPPPLRLYKITPTAEATPFYKNPMVLGIAGVLVVGIGIIAMRKKSA
jgi:hypothetical protein